jgi:glutathione S-transferase
MSLKLFIDYISQPSRAVAIFCTLTGISHEVVETRINRLEHQKNDYGVINPVKKVPAIMDGEFPLFESHSILRYLARSRDVPDHYYPKDPKEAARVDRYLDWHHSNLRAGAAGLVFNTAFAPKLGVDASKIDIEKFRLVKTKKI